MKCISYKNGYKYQLSDAYKVTTPIIPSSNIETEYINLSPNGELMIKKGYAWDGPSGPTVDTTNFMRSSLVHDAFYQLMRHELLNVKSYRGLADKLLYTMSIEDGMSRLRATWVYLGVKLFANYAADPSNKKQVINAPKI